MTFIHKEKFHGNIVYRLKDINSTLGEVLIFIIDFGRRKGSFLPPTNSFLN